MTNQGNKSSGGWSSAWPDALAFAAGLGLAWWFKWETRDLVWSLWLSSLVVGYAMIGWTIFGQALERGPIFLVGGLFLLGFFTFHFGLFHFVHSVFLNAFFPAIPGTKVGPSFALYARVLADYWPFVLVTAVAERQAFRRPEAAEEATTSGKTEGGAKRKHNPANNMMAPYRNVIRMHLLIFFFAGVSFLKLDSFVIYAVVYAVYFFPWRMLGRKASGDAAEA